MKEIEQLLFKYKEESYGNFQAKLTPTLPRSSFIGVRVPNIKIIVKEIINSKIDYESFLNELPHKYYDENMVHTFLLCNEKDFKKAIIEVEKFLPYIDNWATSDSLHPKAFNKNPELLLPYIEKWLTSKHTYTLRYAIDSLMTYFLDDRFKKEYIDKVCSIKSNEYYVNMMIAWYLATALVKQYDITIKVIESKTLNKWIQNKTIQKAIESYRIDNDVKDYLRSLKI